MSVRAFVTLLLATACAACTAPDALGLSISPLRGTRDASPLTQISFLGADPTSILAVRVVGSRSGTHRGRLAAYAGRDGASFLLDHPLVQGERVTVSARVGSRSVGTRFDVARLAAHRFNPPSGPKPAAPGTVQSFLSRPDLLPPVLAVSVAAPTAAPGDVFLAPNSGAGQYGPMIVDGTGRLLWFQPLPPGTVAMDFQVQRYLGQPVLVWWQGYIASLGVGFGADEIYDSSYRRLAEVTGGNGYRADLHEVQLTPSGSALVTAYSLIQADLSPEHGPRHAILLDSIVQEVDVRTGLVKFEWHALGHVGLGESAWPLPRSDGGVWDFFHINSVSLGTHDDLLISARNTWAGYDISRASGRVLWRLGGEFPSFHMGAGTGTAWQHDMRWLPDGTISVFDNGSSPRTHSQSRVIRERVDFAHHRVTLLSRGVHSPPLLADSQGNDQLLANGDSFVGWGAAHFLSELSPSGQLVFDAYLPANGQTYRAYRFPWIASPTTSPVAAAQSAGAGRVTVAASWNGATEVASWRVLAGATPATMTPVAQVPRTGFETTVAIGTGASSFAVQALDAAGTVLGTSPATGPH